MTTIPTGTFMQPALCASEPMAYVVGGEGLPKMIAESEYRAAGYEPPFEMLPTLDEYEVAEEAKGSRAPNEWEGSAMKYADLWMAMKRYKAESDAWQEFAGGVYEQTDGRWPNEVAAAEAPEAFARHWAAVAAGASGDFDVNGARASIPRRNQDGASIH